jgi:DNA invertase Pin-like site-specific DNA recombinase
VASGAKTDRTQLRKAIAALGAGDELVTRLDRLARSTRDLLNTLATITDSKGRLSLTRRCLDRHRRAV